MPDRRWEAALSRIFQLIFLLGRDSTSSLARMGLTESRAHLLWELQARGPCSQRALASALHVTPRAVTALVDALVETGFVTREPCATDRRATLVTFTEHGRTTAQAMAAGYRELARQLFADLPDETFNDFDAGLSHVVDRLRILLADPAGGEGGQGPVRRKT
jgi:DNA-binding MarR family transcriptional regulator